MVRAASPNRPAEHNRASSGSSAPINVPDKTYIADQIVVNLANWVGLNSLAQSDMNTKVATADVPARNDNWPSDRVVEEVLPEVAALFTASDFESASELHGLCRVNTPG